MHQSLYQAVSALSPQVECRPGAPLDEHTTYRIGGPAEVLAIPHTRDAAVTVAAWCRTHGVPLTILGNGSNVLVPDEGLEGVVLVTAGGLVGVTVDDDVVIAEAGVLDEVIAREAAHHGLEGFTFLYDIPGSVGGAAIMNAGNQEGTWDDVVVQVTAMDEAGRIVTLAKDDMALGYRSSLFKGRHFFVLEAVLRATGRADPVSLRGRNEGIRATRCGKFPGDPNCGSVFKRPEGSYAGYLIETAGCKGLTVGDAMVSTLHAGFIVNRGHATAADVKALVAEVQARVEAHAGILLERELIYLE